MAKKRRLKNLKIKMAYGTSITEDVRMTVRIRDNGRCVFCGSDENVEHSAHYIPRSEGGMGIPENVVTLCNNKSINKCHQKFDFGTDEEKQIIGEKIEAHLKKHYPGWSREKVIKK